MKAFTPTIAFLTSLFTSIFAPLIAIEPPNKSMPIAPTDSEQEVASPQPSSRLTAPRKKNASATAPEAKFSEQQSLPFAGIRLSEIPEELAKHLALDATHGALVRLVAPNSPADQAGIQAFDIIEKVDGKQIRGHECLCSILKKHQPGDEIAIHLLRRATKMELKMTLGVRPHGLASEPNPDKCDDPTEKLFRSVPERYAPEIRKLLEQNLRALGQNDPHAFFQLRSKELEKLRQQADQALKSPMIDLMPDASGNMSMHTRVSVIDDNGRIEVIRNGDFSEARVYDKQGELEWSGPFLNNEDKKNIPEDVRQRLQKLNITSDQGDPLMGSGLRLNFGSGK